MKTAFLILFSILLVSEVTCEKKLNCSLIKVSCKTPECEDPVYDPDISCCPFCLGRVDAFGNWSPYWKHNAQVGFQYWIIFQNKIRGSYSVWYWWKASHLYSNIMKWFVWKCGRWSLWRNMSLFIYIIHYNEIIKFLSFSNS